MHLFSFIKHNGHHNLDFVPFRKRAGNDPDLDWHIIFFLCLILLVINCLFGVFFYYRLMNVEKVAEGVNLVDVEMVSLNSAVIKKVSNRFKEKELYYNDLKNTPISLEDPS